MSIHNKALELTYIYQNARTQKRPSSQICNVRCPFKKIKVKSNVIEGEMSNDVKQYYRSHLSLANYIIPRNCRCIQFQSPLEHFFSSQTYIK